MHVRSVGVVLNYAARADCDPYPSKSLPTLVGAADGAGNTTEQADAETIEVAERSALVQAMEVCRLGAQKEKDDPNR